MQFPFNWLALGIVQRGLEASCVVHLEDKVLPEVCSVDAWVEPREGRAPRNDDDWLARMGYEPSEIEPFHTGPSLGEHNDSIMKVMALHARERKRAEAEGRSLPPTARLWFACAQHPRELIARWAMVPMEGWPEGFYASLAPAGPRAVSLRELPRDPATLLLRMMGTGATLRDAIADLRALPDDARERRVALPILLQLRYDLPRMGVSFTWTTDEEYAAMMNFKEGERMWEEHLATARALAAARQREAEAQRREAEAQRREAETLSAMQTQFERRIGRAFTERERETVAMRLRTLGWGHFIEQTLNLDGPTLAAWIAAPDAT